MDADGHEWTIANTLLTLSRVEFGVEKELEPGNCSLMPI